MVAVIDNYFTICYNAIATHLKSERATIILQRLHYWMQTSAGYEVLDGRKWIYCGYKELQSQFQWLTHHTIGKAIRLLEKIGWVVSQKYYQLRRIGFKKKPGGWQEYHQTKWYRLNYIRIYEDTGIDLSGELEGLELAKRANVPNETFQSDSRNTPTCQSKSSSIQTKKPNFKKTKQQQPPPQKDDNGDTSMSRDVQQAAVQNFGLHGLGDTPSYTVIYDLPHPDLPEIQQPTNFRTLDIEPPSPVKEIPRGAAVNLAPEDSMEEALKELGIQINPQLKRCITQATAEVVMNAIAFVKERKQQGKIKKSAEGLLHFAIQKKLKPEPDHSKPQAQPQLKQPLLQNPTQERKRPRQHHSQEPKHPLHYEPDPIFLEWYKEARLKGWVDDIDHQYLPVIMGSPKVRIPTPDPMTKAPYTLMDWKEARAKFSPEAEQIESFVMDGRAWKVIERDESGFWVMLKLKLIGGHEVIEIPEWEVLSKIT